MTLESGDPKRRGPNASWPQVGVPIGLLLANGALSFMVAITSDAAFQSWGWRVPFLVSGVLVIVGLWIRLTIAESPLFRAVETSGSKARAPIVDVLRLYPKRVLLAVGARVGVDVAFYSFVLFITTYVVTYLELPNNYALNAVLVAAACQVFLIPWFGSLSDRFGRRPVYLFGAVGAAVWIFVFFALLDTGNFTPIVLATVVALFFHAAMYGPQASSIAEMFPTRVRYSGASMGYQLAGRHCCIERSAGGAAVNVPVGHPDRESYAVSNGSPRTHPRAEATSPMTARELRPQIFLCRCQPMPQCNSAPRRLRRTEATQAGRPGQGGGGWSARASKRSRAVHGLDAGCACVADERHPRSWTSARHVQHDAVSTERSAAG